MLSTGLNKTTVSLKQSTNSKTSSLNVKFLKYGLFLRKKNLFDHVFLLIWLHKSHFFQIFSVISVVPIGYDEFLDLNGQNSHFERINSFSDPFYIMVNDWLAMAEPSRVIFWNFFRVIPGQNESFFLNWKIFNFFSNITVVHFVKMTYSSNYR